MWAIFLTAVLFLLFALGVWMAITRSHTKHLSSEKANAEAWQRLALKLSDVQSDATNRLLIRSGVMPAPQPREIPAESEIPHDDDDMKWTADDERAEIDQKARETLANPLQAELIEEAARYDEAWKPVYQRYLELKRTTH